MKDKVWTLCGQYVHVNTMRARKVTNIVAVINEGKPPYSADETSFAGEALACGPAANNSLGLERDEWIGVFFPESQVDREALARGNCLIAANWLVPVADCTLVSDTN